MISKTMYTKNAANTLRYVLRPGKDAQLLLALSFPWTTDPQRQVDMAEGLLAQNTSLKNQAFHFVLAFSPKDRKRLDEIGMDVIAATWLSELERMSDNKFMYGICVRHNDTEHPHCHLVILNLNEEMGSLNSFQLSKNARLCAQKVTDMFGLTVAKGAQRTQMERGITEETSEISYIKENNDCSFSMDHTSLSQSFGLGAVGVIGSDGGSDDDEDDDEDDPKGKKKKKKRRRRR